jgi:catechol 2,3-dioxygenase-like lactoylglutathione lyase family enzyme
MFANTKAYSGFAVDDLQKAGEFYGETLGLKTSVISEARGVCFERYDGFEQDEKGISRGEGRTSPGSRTRLATCCPCSRRSRHERWPSPARA